MHPDGSGLHPVATCTGFLCNQVMPPVWSPDGSRIAYVPKVERSSQIALVSLAGGRAAIRACARHRCVTPYGLVWAPDGSALGLLGGIRSSTAYVVDDAAGARPAVTEARGLSSAETKARCRLRTSSDQSGRADGARWIRCLRLPVLTHVRVESEW
jgi:hypothetical protein